MSVEELALRRVIFVGLELKLRLLESYFLVELVLVPGLSLSQPYVFITLTGNLLVYGMTMSSLILSGEHHHPRFVKLSKVAKNNTSSMRQA
jgi:hypothetical protein